MRSDAIPAFRYRQEQVTVVFGAGASDRLAELGEELRPQRLLVVHGATGATLAGQLIAELGTERATSFTDIAEHVPADRAGHAVALARSFARTPSSLSAAARPSASPRSSPERRVRGSLRCRPPTPDRR